MDWLLLSIIILILIILWCSQKPSTSEAFADFGSGRATPPMRPVNRKDQKRQERQIRHNDRQIRRDQRQERRDQRQNYNYNYNYDRRHDVKYTNYPSYNERPYLRDTTIIYDSPSIWSYFNPWNRYDAPYSLPTTSSPCSDYASNRCEQARPYQSCWNRQYRNCVDGLPSNCSEQIAEQCANSTDFQSCYNFYNRVACPTIY